jgi:hypothetical protein
VARVLASCPERVIQARLARCSTRVQM